MKLSSVLAILAGSSTALAGNPPAGHWRMTVEKQYKGDLFLAPVGDRLCAYYRYDNDVADPGAMTLAVHGDAVTGTYDEGIERGTFRWKLAGNKLVGVKLAGHDTIDDGDDPEPWTASFVSSSSIEIAATYNVDWYGAAVHSTIHFIQQGDAVVGRVSFRNSGDADGMITGVMYGELLAAVYVGKHHGGSSAKFPSIVLMHFAKGPGSRAYNTIDGVYSGDMSSCMDNGRLGGQQTN